MHVRKWTIYLSVVATSAALALGGCGAEPEPGTDGGLETDGGTLPTDGGNGNGNDTDGGNETDAGNDTDAGMDMDAGMDADAGIPMDAGMEMDAGTFSVSFANDVRPIFNQRCTSCHGSKGGLSLGADAHAELVGVDMVNNLCSTLKRVEPGNAANSGLYRKITGTTCGNRMPASGGTLTAAQITTIETWIAEGAPNN